MMLEKLFPKNVKNVYRGHALAEWILAALTLLTLGRSLIHMFAEDGGAQSIASMPVDTFSGDAGNAVITIFALWGLSQLIIGMLYALVLWRYQSLIPLMYALFSFEYFMRLISSVYSPGLETVNTAPGAIGNILLLPLGQVMLAFSLRGN